MAATMAWQGGRVELEQSDMRLALHMAKMAKEWFSHAAIVETQYRINRPGAEVREVKKRGVEFDGHTNMRAAIDRPMAMRRYNHMAGRLLCHDGTGKNLQTCCRRKGTCAPRPDRHR